MTVNEEQDAEEYEESIRLQAERDAEETKKREMRQLVLQIASYKRRCEAELSKKLINVRKFHDQ